MTAQKLTKAQIDALAKLRQLDYRTAQTFHGNIATGVNTTMLHSLRNKGMIECAHVYLNGVVSPDLRVVVEAI